MTLSPPVLLWSVAAHNPTHAPLAMQNLVLFVSFSLGIESLPLDHDVVKRFLV